MLYDCGHVDDYVYVYDSENGKCSLLKSDACRCSLQRVSNKSFSFAKLRMLYNFHGMEFNYLLSLFRYGIKFMVYPDFLMEFGFRLFNKHACSIYGGSGNWFYDCDSSIILRELDDFSVDDWFLFMYCNPIFTKADIRSSIKFRHVQFSNGYFIYGIPAPVHMLQYVSNLCSLGDQEGVDEALGGFICKNMEIYYTGFSESVMRWHKEKRGVYIVKE